MSPAFRLSPLSSWKNFRRPTGDPWIQLLRKTIDLKTTSWLQNTSFHLELSIIDHREQPLTISWNKALYRERWAPVREEEISFAFWVGALVQYNIYAIVIYRWAQLLLLHFFLFLQPPPSSSSSSFVCLFASSIVKLSESRCACMIFAWYVLLIGVPESQFSCLGAEFSKVFKCLNYCSGGWPLPMPCRQAAKVPKKKKKKGCRSVPFTVPECRTLLSCSSWKEEPCCTELTTPAIERANPGHKWNQALEAFGWESPFGQAFPLVKWLCENKEESDPDEGKEFICISSSQATGISLRIRALTLMASLWAQPSAGQPHAKIITRNGGLITALIWSLQHTVRQMSENWPTFTWKWLNCRLKDLVSASVRLRLWKNRMLCLQETKYQILLLWSSCKFKHIRTCIAKIETITFFFFFLLD